VESRDRAIPSGDRPIPHSSLWVQSRSKRREGHGDRLPRDRCWRTRDGVRRHIDRALRRRGRHHRSAARPRWPLAGFIPLCGAAPAIHELWGELHPAGSESGRARWARRRILRASERTRNLRLLRRGSCVTDSWRQVRCGFSRCAITSGTAIPFPPDGRRDGSNGAKERRGRHLHGISRPGDRSPPFEVADEAACVPIGALTRVTMPPDGYVIIGAGKTAMDGVCWLLDNGTSPDDIRWIRPRDPWMLNRAFFQPGEGLLTTFTGIVLELEAVAECESIEQVFDRLEEHQVTCSFRSLDQALHDQGRHGESRRARSTATRQRRGAIGARHEDRLGEHHPRGRVGPDHPRPTARALRLGRTERQSSQADLHRHYDPAAARSLVAASAFPQDS
jgi:hypothetical protein